MPLVKLTSQFTILQRYGLSILILLLKMVPGAGIEPARGYPRGILSPLRLPIPPPGQTQIEA